MGAGQGRRVKAHFNQALIELKTQTLLRGAEVGRGRVPQFHLQMESACYSLRRAQII